MKNQETLTIYGLNENIAYCEAIGLSKCFEAYAEHFAGDEICGVGFNPNSGYVYISLEEGMAIVSMLGRDVEYLVTDFDSGEEFFFDTIEEAISSKELFNAM
jgi:hypothetical protein